MISYSYDDDMTVSRLFSGLFLLRAMHVVLQVGKTLNP